MASNPDGARGVPVDLTAYGDIASSGTRMSLSPEILAEFVRRAHQLEKVEAFLREHGGSVVAGLQMALEDLESEFGVGEEWDEANVTLEAFRALLENQ